MQPFARSKVPEIHPMKWATVTRHFDKLAALYEKIVDKAGGTASGLIAVRDHHGRDNAPQPKNEPGLAVPERYRR